MSFGRVRHSEIAHRLGHLIGQAHLRVQAGERILKHHLHIRPRPPQPGPVQRHDIHPVQHHARPAVGSISRRIDRPALDLPQPDLAHQRQGAPLVQRKRDILDRMHIGHRPAQHARR